MLDHRISLTGKIEVLPTAEIAELLFEGYGKISGAWV